MNPAAVFVLMLGIGIPLTFIKSVILNVAVSSVCLAYLLFCKVNPKTLLTMLLVALPLAFWQLRFTTLLRIARSGSHGLDLCYENHCLSDPWSNADFAEFGRKDFV